ncbi:MAG TPA: T9SS type B sorting domain-containing protein, partial [Flavobacteriaceae bacterium]|nr:T9SS type B sorting domain-containing protein [Flavobacteriaceae bacterium]
TDVPFCTESSNAVTITSPSSTVTVVLNATAGVTCSNDGGALTAQGSGGTTPYEYELVNNTTSTTVQSFGANNNFENLSAGDYTVTIRDANGCTSLASQTLTQPVPINASITANPTNLLCYGDATGSVSAINVTGGQGSYQYILNFEDGSTAGPQVSNMFDNLVAGTYSITVIDGLGCDFTTPTVTITEPSPVTASLVQLNGLTCFNDGSLELSASGGTPPYQYSTDGVSYSGSFTASVTIAPVSAGVYQYYVRDANGCEASVSNQVSIDAVQPLALNIDTSNAVINCTGDATAIIRAEATGGLGNYMYELLDSASAVTPLEGPQSSGTFSDYTSGTYYVRVTSGDCVETSGPITIVEPEPLVIDSQSSTNVTCLGQDDGTITVEASGGTGIIKYAITPNLDKFDTVNTFTDLAPGTYEVIVQDENGCYIDLIFDIVEPSPISVSAITVMPETCLGDNNAFIEVEITGGTPPYSTSLNTQDDANYVQDQYTFSNLAGGQTYVIFVKDSGGCDANVIVDIPEAANLDATLDIENLCVNNASSNSVTVQLSDPLVTGVTYALDNGTPQTSNTFTDLVSGDHFIEVIHPDGCSKIYDFNIQAYEPLTLVLAETNVNEITATATGGAGDYEFYFNGESTGSDNVYHINQTGTYNVRVVDALGCEALANIYAEFVDICVPNFFTPDGDGNNDTWAPCNVEGFPNILTRIYDRYGRVVAVLEKVESWDGRYNGNELPTGDYWYVIKLNQSNDDREFVGHFTLYR